MHTYMNFQTSIARTKPSTLHNQEDSCPFCDRETIFREGVVISQDGPFLLIENKFQTLENAYQMVLVETETCEDDLSTYDKQHLHALFDFAIRNWLDIEASGTYRSVIFFKNHGIHSGGSIHHAHMQIVGLYDVDYREHLRPEHFTGIVIDSVPGVEFNVSTRPRGSFTEFNVVLSDRDALHKMSEYVQIAVHFILTHMNKRYKSYNIFFYEYEGKIIAKIVLRAPGSPYLMGYSIIQVPNNLGETVQHVQSLYFTNTQKTDR
jgi:ATP adenylyltransferase/5',5'''-P-1,P-4-tetraphosphate phosphorylase II